MRRFFRAICALMMAAPIIVKECPMYTLNQLRCTDPTNGLYIPLRWKHLCCVRYKSGVGYAQLVKNNNGNNSKYFVFSYNFFERLLVVVYYNFINFPYIIVSVDFLFFALFHNRLFFIFVLNV